MMFGGSNSEDKAKLLKHPRVNEIADAHKHANSGEPVSVGQVTHPQQFFLSYNKPTTNVTVRYQV